MGFEISIERIIKAERDFVFDWWTDLSPSDSSLVKPLKSRRIISKTPTQILLKDEEEMYFRRMSFDVKVTLERPVRWISEYDGKDASARSEYILTPQDGATTLNYHTKIEPKGALTRLFSPIVKLFVRHVFAGEMKIFIETLENDYRRQIGSPEN